MSFQILNIILYGKKGQKRIIDLRPGELNIITGASKTGKTALIEIIDYCLANKDCKIPEGIIRKTVAWVGLRLSLRNGQAFIARKLPDKGYSSSEVIYYVIQPEIKIPELTQLHQTVNRETLEALLSKHVGIGENVHRPPEGQTRPPLVANIRHTLFFTFQQQSEVISNKHLFHKQSEEWIPQTIKDVLPYFLGAVNDDYVRKIDQLRNLRTQLRNLERKLTEFEAIKGDGISRAHLLLSEAQDLGLYPRINLPDSWNECVDALREIQKNPVASEEEIAREDDTYERLQSDRIDLIDELKLVKMQLESAKSLQDDRMQFSRDASEHLVRLRSIELFEEEKPHLPTCPLCQTPLGNDVLPAVADLRNSIERIDTQIRSTTEPSPKMQQAIHTMEAKVEGLKLHLLENRETLEAIQVSRQILQEVRDRAMRRAYILGRIGLYLESLPQVEDTSNLHQEIDALRLKIEQLEKEVDIETIREKRDSILSIISRDMTNWARKLQLEHSEFPLRLDLNRLLVVADTADGPVPMDKMGSGENWVGYHLITHFALHKWFVIKNRPIPRFLFIDQPSQVYFPADKDIIEGSIEGLVDEDREAVVRMFKLALEVTESLSSGFQIIITDHADIKEDWFQNCVVQRWRKGEKLVPVEWNIE